MIKRINLKKCNICNECKPVTEFSKNKSKADGYQYRCKTCVKQWKIDNPDKTREYHANHRGFGSYPLNEIILCVHEHHLHIENRTDFSIYIPYFLHEMWHSHSDPDSMVTPNAIALDFRINKELYNVLYSYES